MDEKIPQLTLTPDLEQAPAVPAAPAPAAPPAPAPEAGPDMAILSEAEQKAVHDFAKQID